MMMLLSLLVAASENSVIGRQGVMPWHLRTDLKRFRTLTQGHVVIMGRTTYQSIGHPLPQRDNIVVSRDPTFFAEGVHVFHTLEAALQHAEQIAREKNQREVFIIGGGELYEQTFAQAQRIYLTHICAKIEGDTFFPEIDLQQWQCCHEEFIPVSEQDDYPSYFKIYNRRD